MAKPTHQRTRYQLKFDGVNIMICGCFSAKSVGKITVIDGKMNAQMYKVILQEYLMYSVESLDIASVNFFQ